MMYRQMGRNGPEVSVLSLGSWYTYGRLSFEAGVSLVNHAMALGIDTFDVAYYRDKPHTEVLFGKILDVIDRPRDQYKIIEKVWFFSYPQESLAEQLDKSLLRLGTTYADLVISEHPRDGMNIDKLAEELGLLVASGRTRSWGALNWKAEDVRKAVDHCDKLGLPGPQCVQMKYSLSRCNVVDGAEYSKLFEDTGITLHASDTMEGGILAGKRELERKIGIDTGNIREKIKASLPKLEEIAESLGVTTAQVSLAFCLANPRTSSVLFGATTKKQLTDNVAAIHLAQKSGDKIRELVASLSQDDHEIDAPYPHVVSLTDEYRGIEQI